MFAGKSLEVEMANGPGGMCHARGRTTRHDTSTFW